MVIIKIEETKSNFTFKVKAYYIKIDFLQFHHMGSNMHKKNKRKKAAQYTKAPAHAGLGRGWTTKGLL